MNLTKILAGTLSVILLVMAMSGCGSDKAKVTDAEKGKVSITIGNWPAETNKKEFDYYQNIKEKMSAAHSNINLIPDNYSYDTKTFMLKATGGQLPTMYNTWFTEIKKIIQAGHAADITKQMNERNFTKSMNPELLSLLTDENGKIYGVPFQAYAQGLFINKKVFSEAGLVIDGKIKVPNTYQELAEYGKMIKEKTGKAGFALPTANNCGGWNFMNIAWSYGVEFVEQKENGKWKSIFNSEACRNALQYVYDLKWKYNVLPDNTVIDLAEQQKIFASGQAGMIFNAPPGDALARQYGMSKDDIYVARMPEGPKGRYTQMGGTLMMFSPKSTPEQIDAALTWIEFLGKGPTLTEEIKENLKSQYMTIRDQGGIVLDREPFDVWVNQERIAETRKIQAGYTNVDPANFSDYYTFDGIKIKPEEPVACQELYAILDKCIQEVITNKNADIAKLIATASNDFQVNHLDKID